MNAFRPEPRLGKCQSLLNLAVSHLQEALQESLREALRVGLRKCLFREAYFSGSSRWTVAEAGIIARKWSEWIIHGLSISDKVVGSKARIVVWDRSEFVVGYDEGAGLNRGAKLTDELRVKLRK